MTILQKVQSEGISLKALTPDELYQLCKERGLTNVCCDIVRYRLLDELSNKEIYTMLGYSRSRYFGIKKRIKTDPVFYEI